MHVALTLRVCARFAMVPRWHWYLTWNALAIATILLLVRLKSYGKLWEFAHDWLPAIFFTSAFEEVSFRSLTLRGAWQNATLIAWESALFAVPPGEWLRQYSSPWFRELLGFGYASFHPLYPVVGGALDMAGATTIHWCVSPNDRCAECRLRHLLHHLLAVLDAQPLHNVGLGTGTANSSSGRFHFFVRRVQGNAGVHGNAFPSAHTCWRLWCWYSRGAIFLAGCYLPRAVPWILVCMLLMCAVVVYEGWMSLLAPR